MGSRQARSPAATFRAGLEITNRSGSVTRRYRLILRPEGVRVAYAEGRVWYDLTCDATGATRCTCAGFAELGECKHLDAVLALLAGLNQRLGRGVTQPDAVSLP